MKIQIQYDSFLKSAVIGLTAALALTGCGDKAATGSEGGVAGQYEVAGDHAMGNPNAKVTVVEYASVTCAHCANWHETVWPKLRKDYVDSGKVRFIYREFPTPPVRLAEVGFLIANCAAEDKYFANIALQYEKQRTLIQSARDGRAMDEYRALAKAAGLNEKEFEACLANEEEYNRIQDVVKGGFEKGVGSTPTFIINGEIKSVFKLEDFDKEFANFIEVPEREKTEGDAPEGDTAGHE